MSVRNDITAPYSPVEAFLYETFAGRAVAGVGQSAADRMLALPRGSRVLDVGCGAGHHALSLARRGYVVTGVDLSEPQIRRARRAADRLPPDVPHPDFEVADAANLPFEDGSFAGLYSICSIKHWPDREAGLRECLRVLEPGGLFVLAEVDRGCTMDDARQWIHPQFQVPRGLRTVALMAFRTFVAGPSLDLRDADELLGRLKLDGGVVARLPGTPLWILQGRKPT